MQLKFDRYLAEFIGTFFLVFTIGLNVLQNTALAPVSIGSMLMVLVFATGSISGAHFNPAVTLGILATQGKSKDALTLYDAFFYCITHCFASFFAGMLYYWILGATFTFQPGHGFTAVDAIAAELLFTAALVYVVLSTATTMEDKNNNYFGLAIGFTLMSAAFAIGDISGCCLNPAVAFGVMMSNHHHTGGGLEYFMMYTTVPLVGALLAAGLFRLVRRAEYTQRGQLP